MLEPVLEEIDRKPGVVSVKADTAIAGLTATLVRAEEAIRENESRTPD